MSPNNAAATIGTDDDYTDQMASQSWAKSEREQLADLLESVGPTAPTLCGDWTTNDLAAHLVLRESRPDAAIGIVLPQLSGHTDNVQQQYATRNFDQLVESIRSGPPRWSGFRLPGVDTAANTTEYFVHLEDIRRAAPHWEPRDLDPEFQDQLWRLTKQRAPALMRRCPVGVELVRNDVSPHPRITAVRKSPSATISGNPAELLLYAFGRKDHALVKIDGDAEAVTAVTSADFSV